MIEIRIPGGSPGPVWTKELADTAIDKPLLDRPGGNPIGKIVGARVDGSDLVLEISGHVALDILLAPRREINLASIVGWAAPL